jgi:hypothetical protein
MVLRAHEIWEDADSRSFEFGLPHPTNDALRGKLNPKARLLHVIFAGSRNAAMKAYHEWQGWGEYEALEEYDVVYAASDLQEQKRLRPELYHRRPRPTGFHPEPSLRAAAIGFGARVVASVGLLAVVHRQRATLRRPSAALVLWRDFYFCREPSA